MSNNYFQFKQFTIQQEHCAMKVSTDACLFGAWAAETIKNEKLIIKNCLDIGTGTGLLSLMLAQKSNSTIEAVEMDEQAAIQAEQNFQASPWKKKLQVHHTTIQQFNSSYQYDFIIANPPFFDNNLKSENAQRNTALHSTALSLEELVVAIKKYLSPTGKFAVLLPYHRTHYFLQLATDFFVVEKVLVKQTPKHNYFRSMLLFSTQPTTMTEKEIIIQLEKDKYSIEFIELLKNYYFYL